MSDNQQKEHSHPENGTGFYPKVESTQKRLWIGIPWDWIYRAIVVLGLAWVGFGRPGLGQGRAADESSSRAILRRLDAIDAHLDRLDLRVDGIAVKR